MRAENGERPVAVLSVFRQSMMPAGRMPEVLALAKQVGVVLVSAAHAEPKGIGFAYFEEPYLSDYDAPFYIWGQHVSDELVARLLDADPEADATYMRFSRTWSFGVIKIRTQSASYIVFDQRVTPELVDTGTPLSLASGHSVTKASGYDALDHMVSVFIEGVAGDIQLFIARRSRG